MNDTEEAIIKKNKIKEQIRKKNGNGETLPKREKSDSVPIPFQFHENSIKNFKGYVKNSPEIIKEIEDRRAQGETYEKIASDLGVGKTTVFRYGKNSTPKNHTSQNKIPLDKHLDESLRDEEEFLNKQLNPAHTTMELNMPFSVVSELVTTARNLIPAKNQPVLDSALRVALQQSQQRRGPSQTVRTPWNGYPLDEKAHIRAERERLDLELEREELRTLRQLRRGNLMKALSTGGVEDNPLITNADIKKLLLLKYVIGKDEKGPARNPEVEIERLLSIFQKVDQIGERAVQKQKQTEATIRQQNQPSSFEKVAGSVKVIAQEVSPLIQDFGKALGQGIGAVKHRQNGPPPPSTYIPETPSEQEIVRKALPPNLLRPKNVFQEGTFSDEYYQPPDENISPEESRLPQEDQQG